MIAGQWSDDELLCQGNALLNPSTIGKRRSLLEVVALEDMSDISFLKLN